MCFSIELAIWHSLQTECLSYFPNSHFFFKLAKVWRPRTKKIQFFSGSTGTLNALHCSTSRLHPAKFSISSLTDFPTPNSSSLLITDSKNDRLNLFPAPPSVPLRICRYYLAPSFSRHLSASFGTLSASSRSILILSLILWMSLINLRNQIKVTERVLMRSCVSTQLCWTRGA